MFGRGDGFGIELLDLPELRGNSAIELNDTQYLCRLWAIYVKEVLTIRESSPEIQCIRARPPDVRTICGVAHDLHLLGRGSETALY